MAAASSSWMPSFVQSHWKLILAVTAVSISGVVVYKIVSDQKPKQKPKQNIKKDQEISQKDYLEEGAAELTTEGNIRAEEEAEASESTEDQEKQDLTDEKRIELANSAKTRGNKYFQARKFDKAIVLYTKAIEYLGTNKTEKLAVFYANRAACYTNLNDYEKVISDCTKALAYDKNYSKAYARRGVAYEKVGKLQEALDDLSFACFIEEFRNEQYMTNAERVLKSLALVRAEDVLKNGNKEKLPSLVFVGAYLKAFKNDYLSPVNSDKIDVPLNKGDEKLLAAVEAFNKKEWELADKLCNAALKLSPEKYIARCLNMRGTFNFLKGKTEEAKKDFEESLALEPTLVNSLIKLSSIYMEESVASNSATVNEKEKAMQCFEDAIKINEKDPDIYYHRGQIYFLLQEYEKALKEYETALSFDENLMFALIQKAVVLYRLGKVSEAEQVFTECKKKFPSSSDVYYYHGEILLDQQKIQEAIDNFDKSIELDPKQPLPHLNKGAINLHFKQDILAAISCAEKAIEVDVRCELAYMQLGQLYLQVGKINESLVTFMKAMELARTPVDAEQAIIGLESAKMQEKFANFQQIKNKT